jgi:hypothetical protein
MTPAQMEESMEIQVGKDAFPVCPLCKGFGVYDKHFPGTENYLAFDAEAYCECEIGERLFRKSMND